MYIYFMQFVLLRQGVHMIPNEFLHKCSTDLPFKTE